MIDVLAALRAELLQTEFFSAGLAAQDVVVSSAFFTGEKYGFGLLLAFSHRFTPGSGEPEKRLRLEVNCLSFLTKLRQKGVIIRLLLADDVRHSTLCLVWVLYLTSIFHQGGAEN